MIYFIILKNEFIHHWVSVKSHLEHRAPTFQKWSIQISHNRRHTANILLPLKILSFAERVIRGKLSVECEFDKVVKHKRFVEKQQI